MIGTQRRPTRQGGIAFTFSTSGQIVPNCFPLNIAPGGISPVAAYRSEQPGAVCQGCIAPPFIGGLPLTGGPGCSISQRRGGGISSRAAPFPMIGKRRGERLCFLLPGIPQKTGLMCEHLARKNALFAKVSSLGFRGGSMIICPARILLNTFHIFNLPGIRKNCSPAFLLWDVLSRSKGTECQHRAAAN